MSEPDLFVVCKNCSSEVSPYVTECPYCGQRVRKRAPKIERGRGEQDGQRRRVRPPRLSPLKRGEIPGIAPYLAPDQAPCPTARSIAKRILTLPTHAGVTPRDVGVMISIIRGES